MIDSLLGNQQAQSRCPRFWVKGISKLWCLLVSVLSTQLPFPILFFLFFAFSPIFAHTGTLATKAIKNKKNLPKLDVKLRLF